MINLERLKHFARRTFRAEPGVDPATEDRVEAVRRRLLGYPQVEYSEDGGKTWRPIVRRDPSVWTAGEVPIADRARTLLFRARLGEGQIVSVNVNGQDAMRVEAEQQMFINSLDISEHR